MAAAKDARMDTSVAVVLSQVSIFTLKEEHNKALTALHAGQHRFCFSPEWLWQEFHKDQDA